MLTLSDDEARLLLDMAQRYADSFEFDPDPEAQATGLQGVVFGGTHRSGARTSTGILISTYLVVVVGGGPV
jgi:hypothetical protein